MELRAYRSSDCPAIADLFYQTVHTVNAGDYSPAQLDAWAPGHPDLAQWDRSLRAHHTVVALEQGVLVGFADMDDSGYLDRLYVHKDYQRRGIATALCDCLERTVSTDITAHVSITAKPFFLGRGYLVLRAQTVERQGVFLRNFVMVRPARQT